MMSSAPALDTPPAQPIHDEDVKTAPNPAKKVILFESGEHEDIGDKVMLQFDGGKTVSGKDFAYPAGAQGEHPLSYGLVVALAGDFYGKVKATPGDREQLSDRWDTDRESSIVLAFKLAKSLSTDKKGYLVRVLKTMAEERTQVLAGIAKGQDVAQIFRNIAVSYDKQYTWDTRGAYALIALCNWDHFGEDAYKAYSAVHSAALRKATEAYSHPEHAEDLLREAYFLEAYAQHFLTDLFSAGHLRTPRRALHRNFFGDSGDEDEAPSIIDRMYAEDRCAQKMHDEDCANGLWVRNARGDQWVVYGDKQLWSGKSCQNFMMAVNACQAGVDEVWRARQSGNPPIPADFEGLKWTPQVTADAIDPFNFSPMFRITPDSKLVRRRHIDKRDDLAVNDVSIHGLRGWNSELTEIAASGENTHMYPFTQQFLLPTSFVHVRQPDPVNSPGAILINTYGPLTSGDYGSSWTMLCQTSLSIIVPDDPMQWIHGASLSRESGVYSFVTVTKPESLSSGWQYYHVGISSAGNAIWNRETARPTGSYSMRDVSYGNYSSFPLSRIAMVKYWESDDARSGVLDLWAVDTSFTNAPTKIPSSTDTLPLVFQITHRLKSRDKFDTFVGYGFRGADGKTAWYFSTWQDDYRTQDLTVLDDPMKVCPQALLSLKWGHSGDPRIACIFFGPKSNMGNQIRIDLLDFGRNSHHKVSEQKRNTQTYEVTWNVHSGGANYLTWFFVKGHEHEHDTLVTVALTDNADPGLVVVVFRAGSYAFDPPIVSEIMLGPEQGTLLTAKWMTPLRAMQTSYTYPTPGKNGQAVTTHAAILIFFDNYAVLGARVLAPVKRGDLRYEFKGQNPAIAGQTSGALGMTLDPERPEAVGILPLKGNF
ncbi:hypothetical protein DFH09DRAFT_1371197 [Mycena vulgaris]|nr:hypothetical protein DFH09DRAFT_1371197 [Mycena vulgaris]